MLQFVYLTAVVIMLFRRASLSKIVPEIDFPKIPPEQFIKWRDEKIFRQDVFIFSGVVSFIIGILSYSTPSLMFPSFVIMTGGFVASQICGKKGEKLRVEYGIFGQHTIN